MTIKDYYIQELNSLRVNGSEFARKNPGLSSYLAKEGQDPDVERILEGFAFLTGKLHQKIDDELPEISHNLTQLMWPNYIRPVPSYTIVKFEAVKESNENKTIPKEMSLLSKATSGVVCKFKVCYETKIMPFEFENIKYLINGQKSSLDLGFEVSTSGSLADIDFDTLRIFLSGSKFMAKELYLYLDRYIEKVEIIIKDDDDKKIDLIKLENNSIKPLGFDSNQTIVPQPENVFDGYAMLQEFFCYPDKHLFIDIFNLKKIKNISKDILSKSKKFSIRFYFSKHFQPLQKPTKDDFKLYCAPAVNLFESDAVPIRKVEMKDEYLLASSELKKEESEVFSIENVRGWVRGKSAYQDYSPFESFKLLNKNSGYYSRHVKLNDNINKTETYIRFASSDEDDEDYDFEHSDSVVSIKMLCTNKDIPSTMQLNDISVCNPLSSLNIDFTNITIPSISYPPPINGDFLWKVISNMSLNYLSLNDIETLKMILKTYDFFGANNIKQREKTNIILSGLKSISNKRSQIIYEGFPISGTETKLVIDPTKFVSIGELYHFCCILNEFFALYCNVNSFHKLIVDVENKELFEFKIKIGNQDIL